jgi:formate hydrogenlyase transcriptional activator
MFDANRDGVARDSNSARLRWFKEKGLASSELIGSSPKFMDVLEAVSTVAPADCAVLIQGETGTGKEVIARAIHDTSTRGQHRFVAINCAAIPAPLIESELFGYERGAFTGAMTQRIGRFQAADRGTLFLDEIGELPLDLQPKLLRAIQEQEFERLGSCQTTQVDVRIVAATNQDLWSMVQRNTFRADLYYRLNVFPITLPPLRERIVDIPLFVTHFIRRFAGRHGKSIENVPLDVMAAIMRYDWPGNIRELQNVIERAVIISKSPVLNVALGELERVATPRTSQAEAKATQPEQANLDHLLDETERNQILRALEASNGVIGGPSGAAARLGLKRSTLQLRMQRLGIRLSPMVRTAVTEHKRTAA